MSLFLTNILKKNKHGCNSEGSVQQPSATMLTKRAEILSEFCPCENRWATESQKKVKWAPRKHVTLYPMGVNMKIPGNTHRSEIIGECTMKSEVRSQSLLQIHTLKPLGQVLFIIIDTASKTQSSLLLLEQTSTPPRDFQQMLISLQTYMEEFEFPNFNTIEEGLLDDLVQGKPRRAREIR